MRSLNEILHWRKARIVRRAVKAVHALQREHREPEYDIVWAVIVPWNYALDKPGWDYMLVRREWGFESALRYKREMGGWIMTL